MLDNMVYFSGEGEREDGGKGDESNYYIGCMTAWLWSHLSFRAHFTRNFQFFWAIRLWKMHQFYPSLYLVSCDNFHLRDEIPLLTNLKIGLQLKIERSLRTKLKVVFSEQVFSRFLWTLFRLPKENHKSIETDCKVKKTWKIIFIQYFQLNK